MAKKKKAFKETNIENYYDLKVDKVDELVAALKEEAPQTDTNDLSMFISDCTGVDDPKNYTRFGRKKEFDPYKTDFLGKLPAWFKALFVKFWFAGAVCYFIMMGLGLQSVDGVIITGVIMGVIVDVLVNPLFRFMESDKREFNAYMMFPFPFKAFWTFFTNIIYYVVVLLFVNYCYLGLNELINLMNGTKGVIAVGVEPLLFGTFCVIVDMAFIGIKDLIVHLVKKSKKEKAANV